MEKQTEKINQEGAAPAAPPARKTAVIVGGSSGIGRETALKLCARGYRVFNLSRTPFKGDRVRT